MLSRLLGPACASHRCKKEYTAYFIAALAARQGVPAAERTNLLDANRSAFDAALLLFADIQSYMASEGLRELMEYNIAAIVRNQEQASFVLQFITSIVFFDSSTTDVYDVGHVPALNYRYMLYGLQGTPTPRITGLYSLLKPIVESHTPFPHPRWNGWNTGISAINDLTSQQLVDLVCSGKGENKAVYLLVPDPVAFQMKNALVQFGFTTVVTRSFFGDRVQCDLGQTRVMIRDGQGVLLRVELTFAGNTSATESLRLRRETARRLLLERTRTCNAAPTPSPSTTTHQMDPQVSWYEETVFDPITMEQVKVKDAVRDDPSLLLFVIDNRTPALVSPRAIADVEDPQQAYMMENTTCMRGKVLFSMNRYGLSGDMSGAAATGIRGYMEKLSSALQPGVHIYRADKIGICEMAEYAGQPVYAAAPVTTAQGDVKMQATLHDTSPWS